MRIEAVIKLGELCKTVAVDNFERADDLMKERLIKALARSIETSLLLQFNLGPTTTATRTRFRKIPVTVEAFQLTKTALRERREAHTQTIDGLIPIETLPNGQTIFYYEDYVIVEHTDEISSWKADINDWIITGANGEVYPCPDDVFKKTYEAVE